MLLNLNAKCSIFNFQLYSDLFVNNGTYNYAEKMTKLGNKVFMYSFDYCNPRSFGILSLRAPFRGRGTYLCSCLYIGNFSCYTLHRARIHFWCLHCVQLPVQRIGQSNARLDDKDVDEFR